MNQPRDLAPIIGKMVVNGEVLEGEPLADYLDQMPYDDIVSLMEDMIAVLNGEDSMKEPNSQTETAAALADAWEAHAKRLRSGTCARDQEDFKFLVASDVLEHCARELRAELNPELKRAMRGRDDIPWWARRDRHA